MVSYKVHSASTTAVRYQGKALTDRPLPKISKKWKKNEKKTKTILSLNYRKSDQSDVFANLLVATVVMSKLYT